MNSELYLSETQKRWVMKRLLIILFGITFTGFLSAGNTLTNKKRPVFNTILNRQEDRINHAFNLHYISYNEYENLYYQLEDIEDYRFRALRDRRIDYRENQILSDLIYDLDNRLDRIFYRRSFCVNYYQPVYLRRQHYTNRYHHYRRPRVQFNVTMDTHLHKSRKKYYNDRYRENGYGKRHNNQRNEYRYEEGGKYSQKREKKQRTESREKTYYNRTKEKPVNKLDKRNLYSHRN